MTLVAAVVTGLTVGGAHSERSNRQDDWRRTAHGWERTIAWPKLPTESAKKSVRPLKSYRPWSIRLDTHPAGLALLQLVGGLAALAAFGPSRSAATAHRPHWKVILARSFRASAFGS
jgi:hypothetical protein